MAVKTQGHGIRSGAATKKVVVCKQCGHKTTVAVQTVGKVRCAGCRVHQRAGR